MIIDRFTPKLDSCLFCGTDVGLYSHNNIHFCKECIGELSLILDKKFTNHNNDVERKLIDVIIFLTFDLKLTRQCLYVTRENKDIYTDIINRKKSSLKAVDISKYEVSEELKQEVNKLLDQHHLLLSLYC
ncbi:TPA: hypothetical protein I7253_15055 [Vibrio vulnificus]|nr:hypothetical protein [Vibrio vulnificus]